MDCILDPHFVEYGEQQSTQPALFLASDVSSVG